MHCTWAENSARFVTLGQGGEYPHLCAKKSSGKLLTALFNVPHSASITWNRRWKPSDVSSRGSLLPFYLVWISLPFVLLLSLFLYLSSCENNAWNLTERTKIKWKWNRNACSLLSVNRALTNQDTNHQKKNKNNKKTATGLWSLFITSLSARGLISPASCFPV